MTTTDEKPSEREERYSNKDIACTLEYGHPGTVAYNYSLDLRDARQKIERLEEVNALEMNSRMAALDEIERLEAHIKKLEHHDDILLKVASDMMPRSAFALLAKEARRILDGEDPK